MGTKKQYKIRKNSSPQSILTQTKRVEEIMAILPALRKSCNKNGEKVMKMNSKQQYRKK